jgi:hypothetical protein
MHTEQHSETKSCAQSYFNLSSNQSIEIHNYKISNDMKFTFGGIEAFSEKRHRKDATSVE